MIFMNQYKQPANAWMRFATFLKLQSALLWRRLSSEQNHHLKIQPKTSAPESQTPRRQVECTSLPLRSRQVPICMVPMWDDFFCDYHLSKIISGEVVGVADEALVRA